MGYRIIYGKRKRRISKGKGALILAIAACIVLMAAAYFNASQQVPAQALENMVTAVQEGQPLTDAITAFCREIIANAQPPQ